IPLGIDDAAVRAVEAGLGGVAAVAFGALTAAGDGRDDAGLGIDLANGVILGVHHVDVALAVAADAFRAAEGRLDGGAAVALVAGSAGAGDGRDGALAIDLADGVAFAFADVGVAQAIDADGTGADDHRLGGRAAVADSGAIYFSFRLAGTGKRGD